VEKDPGYNMCYRNHFERHLSREDGRYIVNGKHDLVFYHFSSYSPGKPDSVTSRRKSRTMSFLERPDLRPIYDEYRNRLLSSCYTSVSGLRWSLPRKPPKSKVTVKGAMKGSARVVLRALPRSFQTLLENLARFTINSVK
jgi:hypothetical protein